MKAITREWVDKAEADYAVAKAQRRSRKKYVRDIVCFHLQQCIEKYLKGRLEEAGLAFAKTHDLEQLLDLILPVETTWGPLRSHLSILSDYAVPIRYPGQTASAKEATELFRSSSRIRTIIRAALGLP